MRIMFPNAPENVKVRAKEAVYCQVNNKVYQDNFTVFLHKNMDCCSRVS